ncbi:hypothetical protein [Rubrivirga sp.]|uniref:hypothetical protein n=1 Tax=Rubrivirga sp. TaxID=1885344 RepID=UPI003B5162B2
MSRKDQIVAELDGLSDADLSVLLDTIHRLTDRKPAEAGVMARLRSIQIDGPDDLAANHDAYASGFDAEP